MLRFFKWIYANKVTLTAFLALLLFVFDEIFKFSKDLDLSQEAYYTIASVIILFIGYAIKGRGLETIEEYQQAVEKIKKLREEKKLQKKLDILLEEKPQEENKE